MSAGSESQPTTGKKVVELAVNCKEINEKWEEVVAGEFFYRVLFIEVFFLFFFWKDLQTSVIICPA